MEGKKFIKELGDDNYSSWSMKIEAILIEKDQFDYLSEMPQNLADLPLTDKDVMLWHKNDRKARSTIIQHLSDKLTITVGGHLTAKAVWDFLKEKFQKKSASSRRLLRAEMANRKLAEGESMRSFILDMEAYFQRIRDLGGKIEDEEMISYIYSGVQPAYKDVITVLESWPEDKIKLADVEEKLNE